MKALVGAFNQEKALVGAFSVIVQPVVELMDRFTALLRTTRSSLASAAEKLSLSNKRKKEMELEICQQLSKTHQVLRKTKTNLETYSNQQT